MSELLIIRNPSAAWRDGEPLMEAIATAVYEQCTTEPCVGLVVDDPRNIAAVAATVARQMLTSASVTPEVIEAGPTAWPTPEDAYATAPGITYEIAWTASTARTLAKNPHRGDVDREYWLRKAALLDRIALEHEANGVRNGTDEIAANAARQLIEIDQDSEGDHSGDAYGPDHPATLAHPRGYVRQEYAVWAENQ
ncbi:hypothetical protein [Streptomyces olivochromogenes]|uniref:hypothetical protein n=1 Tax=Streptomyces olivochromogenes TaxID=1963 RepID=UPI00368C6F4A